MTTFTKPALSPILTKKDWDKKKGVIAKMAGSTGVGPECDKVAAAYAAVKWEKFDFDARRRTVLKNWRDDSFTRANWDKILDDAKQEALGSLVKLSMACYNLRDVCEAAGAEFEKSRTIPASSTKHVRAMAAAADALGGSISKNTMGGILKSINDEFLDEVDKKFIKPMWPGIRTYAKQHANLMANIRKNPTPKMLNEDGRTGVRDLTTGLGNIAKLGERGWGPKNDAARKLCTALTPWANSESGIVKQTASRDQVLAEVAKIDKVFSQALRLVATAK